MTVLLSVSSAMFLPALAAYFIQFWRTRSQFRSKLTWVAIPGTTAYVVSMVALGGVVLGFVADHAGPIYVATLLLALLAALRAFVSLLRVGAPAA